MAEYSVSFVGKSPLVKGHVTINAESIDEAITYARDMIEIKEIRSVNRMTPPRRSDA